MKEYNFSTFERPVNYAAEGNQPVAANYQTWLAPVDNDLQALMGFGTVVIQGIAGIAQMFAQSDVATAKINADSRVASSKLPLIHEEIKRLGARIDKMSFLLFDKYSGSELTQSQMREKNSLEEMIRRDQAQLDRLLQYAMIP